MNVGRLLRARPLLRDDNKRQAVVALSSAELVYRDFELDLDGQLNEYQDRKAMGGTVLALSIRGGPRTASAISCMYIVWFKARANYSQWVAGTRQHTRDDQSASTDFTPPSICILDMLDAGNCLSTLVFRLAFSEWCWIQ